MTETAQTRQVTMQEMNKQLEDLRLTQVKQAEEQQHRTDAICSQISKLERLLLHRFSSPLLNQQPEGSGLQSEGVATSPTHSRPPDPPDLNRSGHDSATGASKETSQTTSLPNGMSSRLTKVGFPIFDGSQLRDWLYRCEQFFSLDNTPPELKVRLASIHLEGKALQ